MEQTPQATVIYKESRMESKYLVITWGFTDPEIFGPYPSEHERDRAACRFADESSGGHGILELDISSHGVPTISSWDSSIILTPDRSLFSITRGEPAPTIEGPGPASGAPGADSPA